MSRNRIRFAFLPLLVCSGVLLTALPVRAQFPGAGELIQTPKITIGKSKSTTEKVGRIVAELEEHEKELLRQQAEYLRWKEDEEEARSRMRSLEKLRLETARVRKETPDQVDPALLPQISANVDLENELADSLSFLLETFKQEQHEVGEALRQGRRLLEDLQAIPSTGDGTEPMSLDEVLQYLEDLRLARISLSLLKARRAGLNEEQEQNAKLREHQFEIPELQPFESNPESRAHTLELRQEMTRRLPLLESYDKAMRRQVSSHIESQLQRIRLQIYEREESLTILEARRTQVFDSLNIDEDAVFAAEERLSAALERISDDEQRLRRRLKTLRLAPPDEGRGGEGFTRYRSWQMELTVLQHQLYLLDIQRQVERFRAASLVALSRLIEGQSAPAEYLESYAWYLDAQRQNNARAELSKRRDAWRQEYAHLSLNEPAPGDEKLATEVLERYQHLLDLYDQIDSAKWELEWCAELVRHYQDRFDVSQRDWFWYAWRGGVTLGVLLAAIFLSLLLGRYTLRPLRRRKTEAPGYLRYTLFFTYLGGILILWATLALAVLANIWGSLFGIERIGEIFDKVLFSIGDKEITLYAFAGLIAVLILTAVVSRLIVRFFRRHIFAYFTWDAGVQDAVAAVVKYIVLFSGFVMGLEFVGIGFGVLAVFAGVIGIGIGFGLQAIASNFISGFTILFERPIKKGDFVDAGGLEGRVDSIRARATTLITRDEISVIVPNSEFVTGRVVNWSHGSERIRLHIPVGVAYGSDVPLVTRLLKEVGDKNPRVLSHPAPDVWFLGFGDSSLNFELLVWTRHIKEKFVTTSDLNYAIDQIFREHNITIPFPQHDVHIKREKGPEE